MYVVDFQFNKGCDKWLWNGECDNHVFSVKALKNLINDPSDGNDYKFSWVN